MRACHHPQLTESVAKSIRIGEKDARRFVAHAVPSVKPSCARSHAKGQARPLAGARLFQSARSARMGFRFTLRTA